MDNVTHEIGESIDMEHVADSALDDIQPGQLVKGEIVTIDNDFVYVNVGTKSDGRVPIEEFDEKPGVGSEIYVVLQSKRFVDGMFQFSKKAADEEKGWQEFMQWYGQGNKQIKGRITSSTGNGKIISCMGVTAFLPFSLTGDLKNRGQSDDEYTFNIKSLDEKKKSIIVSRKDYLDEEHRNRWDSFSSKYNVGDIVKGTPVKFVEFGVFVRIDGIDGLLHRNDMSWKKVFKQRKIVKIGEERDFLILDINREEGKISLGLKQLMSDPWLNINDRFNNGDTVSGVVVTITGYGAFVEIEDGVEGFVNVNDLRWSKMAVNPKDILKKGQKYDFKILGINQDEKKLFLGYKQLVSNPWESIVERYPAGSIHRKRIKKIVKFGMFVELEDDIDGLVHISDVSWDENLKDLSSFYKIGDEVDIKILDIKKDEMKIACGIKQLIKSPWEMISDKYPPRSKVEGTVSGITPFGIFVKIEDNVEGLVHISEVSRRRIDNLEEHFKVGDRISAVILGVDVDKKRLSLSVKSYEIISEKEEFDKIMKTTKPNTVTLGDMVNIKIGE
ncbi:MAG: S1 RNA-binding domain-containing protein [Spirochaetes bacterium]|jgi:small subunit ribosomal protein S1|nr:S1 RNA-binding domain-containing protein [Spirochaetota bacterium]